MILNILAGLLVLMGVVNAYFLWHAHRLNSVVTPRSPLLFALFGVAVAVWIMGAYFAVVAMRYLLQLPDPLPFGGIGFAVVILVIEALPAFIWWQMRRFVIGDVDRDTVRDSARDSGRDLVRDPARDLARDTEHDRES